MLRKIKVWAPFAESIEVVSMDHRKSTYESLQKETGGWWVYPKAPFNQPRHYQFRINHDQIFPDPWSHFQPDGIHGPSELIDHNQFEWHDREWRSPPIEGGLIYELHIGTFTEAGTFRAAISKLSYLKSLGVTHVEVMPVCSYSGRRGWGYDLVFPFSPHQAYGRPEDFKSFINECHRHGLGVILDVIYNHLGPVGNYFSKFGPYFTDKYHTPWGPAINFDEAYSDEVRLMVLENITMWLVDYHIDGLRLDAIHAIYDQSAVHILEAITRHVEALQSKTNRPQFVIAESDLNDPKVIRSRDAWGFGCDAQWSDDFHHAIHAYLTKENQGYYQDYGELKQIAKALTQGYVYTGDYSVSRRRHQGRSLDDEPSHRLVTFIQNHDQIGNRAKGDRLSHLLNDDEIKIAAALNLLAPTTPLIFQGEEWAASTPFLYFTDHKDKEIAKAVREGRRREFLSFGWKMEEIPDPQSLESFEVTRLKWDEQGQNPHKEILFWYKQLLHIRLLYLQGIDHFVRDEDICYSENDDWMHYFFGPLFIVFNFKLERQRIESIRPLIGASLIGASKDDIYYNHANINLPGQSVAILKLEVAS